MPIYIYIFFFFAGLFPMVSAHRLFNFHVLRFCASSIFTYLSFMTFLKHHSTPVSVFLSFGVHSLPLSMFSLPHLLQSSSPHGLTISISLLIFSHLCLPHLALLLLIFFMPDHLNSLYSLHRSQHSHFCSF